MYDPVGDPLELRRRLNAYAFSPDTPPELADRLQRIPGVDADVISEAAELLYAYYDRLNEQGRSILAELTAYGVSQGWNALNREGRWEKIRDRARHDIGDLARGPKDADMPEPQTGRRAQEGFDWRAGGKPADDQ